MAERSMNSSPFFLDEDAHDDRKKNLSLEGFQRSFFSCLFLDRRRTELSREVPERCSVCFNRVQHHVHHKQPDGSYLPLNACKPKSKKGKKQLVKKNAAFCKADFPKSNVLTDETVVVCQGIARKFKLRVRG